MFRFCMILAGMFLALSSGPSDAQTRGGYDPRSWSFDAESGTVSPSQEGPSGPLGQAPASGDYAVEAARVVSFNEQQPAGTIIVETGQRALYYVLGEGRAIRYSVGVGREGFAWSGTDRVSAKREWPDWHPPEDMRKREAANGRVLPSKVAGGPNNPLGARALYIGSTLYRVHGTNEPWTVGTANSSGCIRMTNTDVINLYQRVKIGARVVVRH